MKSGQLNIHIKNGIIQSVENAHSEVNIFTQDNKYSFKDAFVFPGFTDSHGHIAALGKKLNSLDLSDCLSAQDCIEKAISSLKAGRENWILGRGWNQENWGNKIFPSKNILDAAFPDVAVYFTRIDGHAAWVNSKALEISGINKYTSSPQGGTISLDEYGEPSGILIDNAMNLVKNFIPANDENDTERYIFDAIDELLRFGITEVHDMDVPPDLITVFKRLDNEGKLKINVQSYVQAQNDEWLEYNVKPYQGKNFAVKGVKFYADGALGSWGAALLEPYSDNLNNKGLLLIDENTLFQKAKTAVESGLDIATHAIGDAANRMVINVYRKLREQGVAGDNSILRLEHAQIVHPDDIRYFSEHNIYASVQPIHCISDYSMAIKRIGNRVRYSYPCASLKNAGTVIAGGSDFPIESHNPLFGIDAFFNRIPFGEKATWGDEQCLSLNEAIEAYTINPHILSGNSDIRGEIKPGMDANLIILDKDITSLNHEELMDVNVLYVITDGSVVYTKY